MIALAILMLAPPLIGGIRGATVAGVLQFVLLLVALAAGSFWVSAYATGYALPISGYIAAAARLQAMNALGSALPAWEMAGLALCVALGVAALPTLMLRSATTVIRAGHARLARMGPVFPGAFCSRQRIDGGDRAMGRHREPGTIRLDCRPGRRALDRRLGGPRR